MKKGLLSILASALLVVGCQNYDDQFTNLESQISALATTVAGLSQVQTQITSLAATVQSLSTTVSSLPSSSEIASQLSTGLAGIIEDVADLEAAVAAADSSAAVAAIQADIDAQEEVLADLLASSSVFTGSVVVNSVATLDAYSAMGPALAIVNGGVDIDVNTEMDMAKVQELVNEFLTITGDLSYHAAASTIAEVSFDNLTGVQTLTLEQPGGYVLAKLQSAQKISLSDKYEGSVGIIDFRSLKSVVSFGTDSYTNNTIDFNKATEIHLTSLPYLVGTTTNPLKISGKKGGVIDITALRDVNASGDQAALDLELNGPAAVTISELDGEGGSVTLTNVAAATINSYDGDIVINGGVETLKSDNVVAISFGSGATDLIDVNLKGVVDPNFTASTATPKDYGPDISLSTKNDMTDITLSGTFNKINLTGNTNLTTAVISADVTGSLGIVISGNTDLETLTLTGSKAAVVDIDDNNSLTELTVDTTIQKSSAKAATLDGSLSVTGNSDLTTLVIKSKDISTLEITGNDDLTSIDGTGMTTIGATAGGTYTIQNNDLTSTLATNKENATSCEDCDNLEVNDLGSFTTTSKMETLATFLKLVAADTKAAASIYFDTVASTVDKDGAEITAETTWASDATDATLQKVVILRRVVGADAVMQDDNALVKEKRAWLLDSSDSGESAKGIGIDLTVDGVSVLHNGTDYGLVTMTGNVAIDLAAIKSSLATTRATTLGVSFDAYAKGKSTTPDIKFYNTISSATGNNGENYTNAQVADLGDGTVSTTITSGDVFTLSIGDYSIKATVTYADASGTNSGAGDALADKIIANWNARFNTTDSNNAQYPSASTTLEVWGTMAADTSGVIPGLSLATSNSGSKGWNDLVKVTWTKASEAVASAASSGGVTNTIMAWKIGDLEDTSDNNATADQIIFQLSEGTNRIDAGTQATLTIIGTDTYSNTSSALSSSLKLYDPSGGTSTITTQDKQPDEATADVTRREGAQEGTIKTAAVTGVYETRVHWLGS